MPPEHLDRKTGAMAPVFNPIS